MSLITRCPACATQFKVVPDQLKLSDGWVRCGHCSDVFDATRYLENWASGAAATEPSGVRHASPDSKIVEPAQPRQLLVQSAVVEATERRDLTAVESAAPASADAVPAPLDADELDMDLALDEPDLPLDIPDGPVDEASPSTTSGVGQATPGRGGRDAGETADFHTELKQFAEGLAKTLPSDTQTIAAGRAVSSPATAPATASVPAPQEPLGAQAIQQEVEQPADSAAPSGLEPDFMRQGRRRAFWRSPGVRALLSGVALLLSALLAAQWALQERDRLAARYPKWQPLLASLCEPLGCTIGAVRDLQAVVIDSSTLTRRIGDFYSFDLVLKNNAAIPLAVPALELSLTDTADAVISRRVFLPAELPGVPPLLPPASTVPVSLRLSLAAGSDLPMAGYRALVFYP